MERGSQNQFQLALLSFPKVPPSDPFRFTLAGRHYGCVSAQTPGQVAASLHLRSHARFHGHTEDVTLCEKVFECVRSWVSLRDVPSNVIMAGPLVDLALQAMDNEALFEISVDVAVELLRSYHDMQADMPLMQKMVGQHVLYFGND